MPNNVVFNYNAAELKTQIFGYDGTTVRPVAVDSDGKLQVSSLPSFTSAAYENVTLDAGATAIITAFDLAAMNVKDYSFHIKNDSITASVRVALQLSPTDVDSYYVTDATLDITGDTADNANVTFIEGKHYARYARLFVTNLDGVEGATIQVNFNGISA